VTLEHAVREQVRGLADRDDEGQVEEQLERRRRTGVLVGVTSAHPAQPVGEGPGLTHADILPAVGAGPGSVPVG
jgi:hypothetical protein